FRTNEQTAVNNYFQEEVSLSTAELTKRAQAEFDAFVTALEAVGVQVIVVQDTLEPDTPDAVFPNNWISTHEDASVLLYPMFAVNRRQERREDILDTLYSSGFDLQNVDDWTAYEDDQQYLEGTGS